MSKQYWVNVAERVVATFVEAFLASILVGLGAGITPDKSAMYSALIAGAAASLTVIKSVAGTFIGESDSPAWLP